MTYFNIALDWNVQQKNYLFIFHLTLFTISLICDFFLIFNLIFQYNKWAGDHVYSRVVHLTLMYNFNAYPKPVSMSVTLTLRQQQWWCQLIIFNFGKQILLKIKGVHSRILTLSANIYNGCLSPIWAIIYNGCLSLSYWSLVPPWGPSQKLKYIPCEINRYRDIMNHIWKKADMQL